MVYSRMKDERILQKKKILMNRAGLTSKTPVPAVTSPPGAAVYGHSNVRDVPAYFVLVFHFPRSYLFNAFQLLEEEDQQKCSSWTSFSLGMSGELLFRSDYIMYTYFCRY